MVEEKVKEIENALSIELPELFKKGQGSGSPPRTDNNGLVMFDKDEVINDYLIDYLVDTGTFSSVFAVKKDSNGDSMAMKIMKKCDIDEVSSMREIKTLKVLKFFDKNDDKNISYILDYFIYRGHTCLISNLYGPNIYTVLKRNKFRPFLMKEVLIISSQISTAVQFMHSCHLMHTDLKPENIVFLREYYANEEDIHIKVIDFGNATFEREDHTKLISTPSYRAPEVFLAGDKKPTWSYPSDIWSFGCILSELFDGETLFKVGQRDKTQVVLAYMEKVVDAEFPSCMSAKSGFFKNEKLSMSTNTKNFIKDKKMLKERILPKDPQEEALLNLIQQMLQLNPDSRPPIDDVVKHPFFTLH